MSYEPGIADVTEDGPSGLIASVRYDVTALKTLPLMKSLFSRGNTGTREL